MANAQSSKATLVYVGDPMCSWCYGLSDELTAVIDHYGDNINYELVMGGLRPYNTETMVDLKSFLTHHWEDVAKASGQPFTYTILDDATITYDTEPPSRAVMIVREMDEAKGFEFFKKVQRAFYVENRNMHLVESYIDLVEQMDIDAEEFKSKFDSAAAKSEIKQDFQRSSELGVRSFPTILVIKDGTKTVVTQGFAPAKSIIGNVDIVVNK